MLIVCGDSHTSTHGALGALAFGIGSTEVAHVLATQTLWQRKPKTMRITVDGTLGRRRDRQGRDPGDHRPDRRRRGDRACDRIRRQRHPRPVDGRPPDALQHVDRGRRPRRHGGARTRPPTPISRAAPMRRGPIGTTRWRAGSACRAIPAPPSIARSRWTAAPSSRWSPGATAPRTRCRSAAASPTRPMRPTRSAAR